MKITNYAGIEVEIQTDDTRDAKLTDFGKATLTDRYLLPGETYQGLFARVAGYFSTDQDMAQRVYDAISNLWFMPSTPILSNGGTDRGLSISCFLNAVPDSMAGIRDTWAENVNLASNGGGIGTYWGDVRSLGEEIKDRGETSGIIPFIKVMDSQTLAVSQGSLRRGSAAVYLDVHHPEIEEFVEIRKPASGADPRRKCLDIHHGVNITDEFMQAVLDGKTFDLRSPKTGEVRKTIDARTLWIKMLNMRLETGEPYFVFVDTQNRRVPDVYKANGLKVRQSNLCSEIALHTGMDYAGKQRTAVCCLASLNVDTMDEWFGNRQFLKDYLLFLDNVLSDFINKASQIPGFENAVYSAHMERSIGGGVMGFISYLQRQGIVFESAIGMAQNKKLFRWLSVTGAEINREVAEELGSCPDAARIGIKKRWTHMFSIAPTASISIICGGVTPSTEHFPANIFTQKTLSGTFTVKNRALDARLRWYAEQKFEEFQEDSVELRAAMKEAFVEEAWEAIGAARGSVQGLPFMTQHDKDVFKTWGEVDPVWCVEYMAKRKDDICQMASNNLTLPADVEKRDLHQIHVKAWRDGVPSLYYLRSQSVLKASMPSHMAGEMPQATQPHEVKLVDRGPAVGIPDMSSEDKYTSCLACQ